LPKSQGLNSKWVPLRLPWEKKKKESEKGGNRGSTEAKTEKRGGKEGRRGNWGGQTKI